MLFRSKAPQTGADYHSSGCRIPGPDGGADSDRSDKGYPAEKHADRDETVSGHTGYGEEAERVSAQYSVAEQSMTGYWQSAHVREKLYKSDKFSFGNVFLFNTKKKCLYIFGEVL